MNKIFVVFYHKIIPEKIGSDWGFNVAMKTFDKELKVLKESFNIITLDDVYEYLTTGKQLNKTSVAISFDDGYADNFIYAYPLLKKHGLKAAIFPITSRIIKTEKIRPTLKEYWDGKISLEKLQRPVEIADANHEYLLNGYSEDFLTLSELNKMKDVFEIGGHTSTHMKVFSEDRIIDFFDGKNGHWSNMHAYEEMPVVGFPLFPDRGDMSVRRGFLRKDVKDFIKSIDNSFFEKQNWKEELKIILEKQFTSYLDFESKGEREIRVNKELGNSKNELKEMLGMEVQHFSYPFGHYDETLIDIASKYFCSSYTVKSGIIKKGDNMQKLPRLAILNGFSSFFTAITEIVK